MKIVNWWTSLDPEHHFAAPKQAAAAAQRPLRMEWGDLLGCGYVEVS